MLFFGPTWKRTKDEARVWRKGVRSFLCSRSARPKKGLARRPQSKAPHALAWLSIELGKGTRMDARSEPHPLHPHEKRVPTDQVGLNGGG